MGTKLLGVVERESTLDEVRQDFDLLGERESIAPDVRSQWQQYLMGNPWRGGFEIETCSSKCARDIVRILTLLDRTRLPKTMIQRGSSRAVSVRAA